MPLLYTNTFYAKLLICNYYLLLLQYFLIHFLNVINDWNILLLSKLK